MKIREPKKEEKEQTQKICNMLFDLFNKNKEIETVLWLSAINVFVASCFKTAGVPYESYKEDMTKAIDFYKCLWEENV